MYRGGIWRGKKYKILKIGSAESVSSSFYATMLRTSVCRL